MKFFLMDKVADGGIVVIAAKDATDYWKSTNDPSFSNVGDDLKEYTEVPSERGYGESMWSEKEPLTVQQGVLKAALLDSEGLDYAV